jgi:two-component system response regulator RegX3
MAMAPASGADGPTRILVVDDEESYRAALEIGLRAEGFAVDVAADGPEALHRFAIRRPDLVLLDMVLPGMPGLEVCRQMQAQSPVPVIMVSARNGEVDVVAGLEVGAADYVAKPFHLRELVARVQAVLRRVVLAPGLVDPPTTGVETLDTVKAGAITVALARREVTVAGRPVYLSRREFDLLACLVSPPGQVRTRDELIDRLWADRMLLDSRTLDTHVRRLRMKLEPDAANPRYLRTVRGVGFRFDADPGY